MQILRILARKIKDNLATLDWVSRSRGGIPPQCCTGHHHDRWLYGRQSENSLYRNRLHKTIIMSWPSFYGYKYTPIGLRQRDIIEETGNRTVSTTVHLPEGGHLLDIERKYAPDGSIAKKETSCFVPSAISAPSYRPAPSGIAPPSHPSPYFDDYEPRGLGDLERQADDIIANFRARNQTGLDKALSRL